MVPNPTFAAMKAAQKKRHAHEIFIKWDIGDGCGCEECKWAAHLGPWYI